jgi:hypothetical protein
MEQPRGMSTISSDFNVFKGPSQLLDNCHNSCPPPLEEALLNSGIAEVLIRMRTPVLALEKPRAGKLGQPTPPCVQTHAASEQIHSKSIWLED